MFSTFFRAGFKEEIGMKEKMWKVATIPCGIDTCYQLYRRINDNEPDHTGNREWGDRLYDTEEEAEQEAAKLNEMI